MRHLRLPATARIPATAAALAAVLAASLLSACDASPYAASVNGSTIKEAQLNTELRWAGMASDYSGAVLSNYNQLNGAQLTQAGDTSNTYSSAWSAYTLSQMIQGKVVAQAVAARGEEPTNYLYTAALGGIEIENGGVTGGQSGKGGITQMAPSYLVEVTQRLADHAELEKPLPTATLQPYYNNYKVNFYSQVCVRQASVSVQNTNGGVNFAASQAQATTVAQQLEQAGSGSTTTVGGSSTCYTHEQLDAQSASLINTVVALAPGKAAVQKTSYGYQVISVSSRQSLPLAGPVAQLLTTLLYDLQSPASDTVLQRLEARAKVRINPTYGSWHPGSKATLAGVIAPSASPATPVGSSGSLIASSSGGPLGS